MADNQSWFERHPVITVGSTFVVAVLLLLLVAETSARAFKPQWAPLTQARSVFWQPDSRLGWVHVPALSDKHTHRDFSVDVTINRLGFRDKEYSLKRNEKKRLLVLGDSYGWGFGVENHQVFTEMLEESRPDWEIINTSVNGYGTVQQYLSLQETGLQLTPDVVLLLFHDNDFEDNAGKSNYWYPRPYLAHNKNTNDVEMIDYPVPEQSLQQKIHVFLNGNFFIARIFYKYWYLLKWHVQGKQGVIVSRNTNFSKPQSTGKEDSGELLDLTGEALRRINNLLKQKDVPWVIVFTPTNSQRGDFLERFCHEQNIPCLDLGPVFPPHKPDWHFSHDRHWNPYGHQLAANAIETFLDGLDFWTTR
jgi:hypothetical protein